MSVSSDWRTTRSTSCWPRIPDLSDSVAAMSYEFITAYVPYLHAFSQFDQTRARQASCSG